MSKLGMKFLGSMGAKYPGLSSVGTNGNIALQVIEVGTKTMGLVSSFVNYSEEKNRTKELRKQINMHKYVIGETISTAKEKCEIELEILKHKMYIELKNEEKILSSSLEAYKKEIELKINNINYSYKEDKEAQRITRNMCKELSIILSKIGDRIEEVSKLETDKNYMYSLQEDYREVQANYNRIIKLLI